jgi:phosphate-selective porin
VEPASQSGATAAPAKDSAIEERIRRLEREIAELKQRAAEKERAAAPSGGEPASRQEATSQPGSAGASSQQATAKPPDEKSLLGKLEQLNWNVTRDITFKPGLRIQTRYTYDDGTNNNDVFIRRFRLKGAGQIYRATYGAEVKIDNTGKAGASPKAAVENAWLDYRFLPDLAGRAGLYDVPFSRVALTSDGKLLLMSRGLTKDALTAFGLADNGIGGMVRGRPLGGHLEYAVGVFNNEAFDGLGGSGSKSSGFLMPSGRVAVDLLDPAPPAGYADYLGSYIGQGKRLSIGANAEWLGDARDEDEEFDLYAWGTDVFFNYGPYTLQAEYDWFTQTGDVNIDNSGWYVQGGYLLEHLNKRLVEIAPWMPQLELAARYEDLDAPSYNPERQQWTTVGMNLYIHQHNLKVQTDYVFKKEASDLDNNLYQLQLQLDF